MKSLLIPFVVGLFSLNFLIVKGESLVPKVTKFERFVNFAQSVHNVDIARKAAYRKITSISKRFNPGMNDSLRKAIVDEIYEMSIKYQNLDVDLICATITHESGRSWNPRALSHAGAMGLMQIMPTTGEWLAPVDGIKWTSPDDVLYNPILNIRLGARYLSTLVGMYGLDGGLAAYNGGGRIVERWLANDKADDILWTETQNYIPFVLRLYDEFKNLAI